jgi:hypothetical protein
MSFIPKDWKDYPPSEATPIDAVALEDMERRLAAYADSVVSSGSDPASNPFVDITTHGAVGDNTTPNAAALQAAIDEGDTSGRRVYVPQGEFIVERQVDLRSGSILFGNGARSIIRLAPGLTDDVDMLAHKAASGSDITIASLVIDGAKDTQDPARQTTCLQLHNVANLTLVDAQIVNSLIEGAYVYRCNAPKIVRCVASGNGLPQADASGIHLDTCDRAFVGGCVTDDNGFHGIILSSTTDSVIDGHFARGNGFDGTRVQYSSDGNRFANFISDGNFRGAYFTTDSTLNHIYHSTLKNCVNGLLFNVSSNNRATFNHMEGNGEYAVMLVDAGDRNYGYGNTYRGNGSGNVYLEPGSAFDPIPAGDGAPI